MANKKRKLDLLVRMGGPAFVKPKAVRQTRESNEREEKYNSVFDKDALTDKGLNFISLKNVNSPYKTARN